MAYIDSKGKCKGDGSTKMNASLVKIKKIITEISKEEAKLKLALERIVDIEYLFKGVEYQNEVRLILSKTGKGKHIKVNTDESDIPRVYLEVGSILPALEKIVVGPKVERAEEWASAFNYSFLKSDIESIEIEISKLPYK